MYQCLRRLLNYTPPPKRSVTRKEQEARKPGKRSLPIVLSWSPGFLLKFINRLLGGLRVKG
jgi:hypothetical protein